jgi:ankyrin repeat protein
MKMRYFKFIIFLSILISTISCFEATDRVYRGWDIRRFKETSAWPLAQALEAGDFERAEKLLMRDPSVIDVQENSGRFTLLFWAIYARKLEHFQFLLEAGANIHLRNSDGEDVITYAASIADTSEYLRLAIKYGGNINSSNDHKGPVTIETPLICAAGCSKLENLCLLTEAGADVNQSWKDCKGNTETPLSNAIFSGFYQNAEYLLALKKCDLLRPVLYRPLDNDSVYALEALKETFYYADDRSDSLRIQNMIDFVKQEVDSLRRLKH